MDTTNENKPERDSSWMTHFYRWKRPLVLVTLLLVFLSRTATFQSYT